MLQWIEAMSGLVTAGSAVIAVWRYFFAVDLPINLTVPNTFLGKTSSNGQSTGTSVSYNYRLTNSGSRDIPIGKFVLRKRFRLFWRKARNSQIDFGPLPHRVLPNGNMDGWITIERAAMGTYCLMVREYGSRRSAKFMFAGA